MSAVPFLSLLGFAQGALLSLCLFFIPDRWSQSRVLLISLVTVVSITFLRRWSLSSGFMEENPGFFGWSIWASFLISPLFYLYLRSATEPDFQLTRRMLPHFVPALLGLMASCYLLFEDNAIKQQMLATVLQGGVLRLHTFDGATFLSKVPYLILIQLVYYFIISGPILKNAKRSTDIDNQARETTYVIQWLSFIRRCMLLGSAALGIALLFAFTFEAFPREGMQVVSIVLSFAFICSVFYIGICQLKFSRSTDNTGHNMAATVSGTPAPSMLKPHDSDLVAESLSPPVKQPTATEMKYKKSGLSAEHMKVIAEKFHQVMIKDKLYLQNELSMAAVADLTDCSTNHLSQSINGVFDKTFTDIVASMRVEEAMKLLRTNTEISILDIGTAAGFNSKSGFYKAFKQANNTTPSAYRKLHADTENLIGDK